MKQGILDGSSIFVTGGSRGIGRAIVEAVLKEGALVGFTYLSSENDAKELVEGREDICHSFKADSSKKDEIKVALKDFIEKSSGKKLDGLVVNAGIYARSSFFELDSNGWERTLKVNLQGAFNTVKSALPLMDHGSIVMVSSQLAFRGSASGADYAASKAGMLGLSRSLALELAPLIRVNSIAPGYVDTDILSGDSSEKRRERIKGVPLGRIGAPGEIAGPVIFLLSDLSSYITGATLDINGGLFIH